MGNRPDLVVKNDKRKTCLLIDMSVPTDNNISVKEYDKISKFKDLEIEIEKKIWLLKTTTISVIVGALGMIKKGTDSSIPGSISLYIKQQQKNALCETAHLLMKELSM